MMVWRIAVLSIIPLAAEAQFTATLTPETNRAFNEYVGKAESQMDWHARPAGANISVRPTLGKSPIDVADGMIHDWTAAVVVPHATIEKALQVFQNYAEYKTMFGPEVVESKLLAHNE